MKKTKKTIKKTLCDEFISYKYNKKTKKIRVCVDYKKNKYVVHKRFQSILLKELKKTLKDDLVYIPKKYQKDYNKFIKKYAKHYILFYTKQRKKRFRGYTPGELAHMIHEDFMDKVKY